MSEDAGDTSCTCHVRAHLASLRDEQSGPEIGEVLRDVIADSGDAGSDLARFVAYDPDGAISETARLVLYVALQPSDLPTEIRESIARSAGVSIRGALEDPGVSDDRKYALAPLYAMCGGELSPEQMLSLFDDFEAAFRRGTEATFRKASDLPRDVEGALRALGLLDNGGGPCGHDDFDMVIDICSGMCEVNPAAAAAVLAATIALAAEHGLPQGLGEAVLELLSETRCERSSWCLGELSRWPALGSVGLMARELAEDMSSAGVAPRAWLGRDFSHGFLTGVGGDGTRAMLLFFRSLEGDMDGLVVVLNDEVGLVDIWLHSDGAKLNAHMRWDGDEVVHSQCSLEMARELLGDAWAAHRAAERPFPGRFFVYRPYFGQEPIVVQPRVPAFGTYALEIDDCSPGLIKGSEDLVLYPAYGQLLFSSETAYAYVRRATPDGRGELSQRQLEGFVREVAEPAQALLLSRMAANMEVEFLAGRANYPVNRLAVRTWLALRKAVVPFDEVPYVAALCKMSVASICEALRCEEPGTRQGFTPAAFP